MVLDTQHWLDTWNSRDDDAIAALCTEDVVVNAVVLGIEPRRYEGREGIHEWLQDVRHRFHADSRAERITPLGDDAMIVEGTLVVASDTHHEPTQQSFALLIRLRDELAEWIGTFMTADEARDAYARGIV